MTWTCDETRDRLREQRELPAAAVEHIAACALCQDIMGMLSHEPSTPHEPADTTLDMHRLLDDTRQCLTNERGLIAWLRSRPNTMQIVLGLVATVIPGALIIVLARRPDLEGYPASRLALFAIVLVVSAVLALRLLFTPLYRRTTPAGEASTLVVAFGIPFLLAALAPAHASPEPSHYLPLQSIVAQAIPCLRFGVVTALPAILLLLLTDRVQHLRRRSVVTAAAIGGLCGNLVLLFHCGNEMRLHRILGHALIGLVLLAVCIASVAFARGRQPDSSR